MNENEESFEAISDRIAQAKGDCALLLIDRIVTRLRLSGLKIESMEELCRDIVSGQFNDPAAEYALADFTHDDYDAAQSAKRAAMRAMIEDDRHERTSDGDG